MKLGDLVSKREKIGGDVQLTVCIFNGGESVSSDLYWLLEEDGSEGIHSNVEPEADESEYAHYQHHRRNQNEERNCGNASLDTC
jgi:hypothetical protein